ncbi:hypothetical protein DSECCO2_536540 [anaerobic digester metagenome]
MKGAVAAIPIERASFGSRSDPRIPLVSGGPMPSGHSPAAACDAPRTRSGPV